MIEYFKDSKGRFKEAYVYTNKNECLGCRTKGIAEYIDKLEKALDKACEVLEDFSNTYDCYHPKQKEPFWKEQWKEYLLKEVQEDE